MSRFPAAVATLALSLLVAAPAAGEPDLERYKSPKGMPAEVGEEAQVVDKRGTQLPLDVVFDDEQGNKVKLADLMHKGRPAVLQFVYFRCPSLCNEVLNGTTDLFRKMEMVPGKDFDVITISINPKETSNLARGKKENYIDLLAKTRPETKAPAERNWRFLTGSQHNIGKLAGTAGFGFKFDMQSREYAHGAALFVLTPEGKISRTIFGATYHPQTVRLSLVEASQNRIGSALDRILLFCYHFDPATGQYTPEIMTIARLVGGLTVLFLVVLVGGLVYSERRKRAALTSADGAAEVAPAQPTTLTPAAAGPGEAS